MRKKMLFLRSSSLASSLLVFFRGLTSFMLSIILALIGLGPLLFLVLVVVVNEIVRLLVTICVQFRFGGSLSLSPQGSDNIWQYRKEGNNRICMIVMFSPMRRPFTPQDLAGERARWVTNVLDRVDASGKKVFAKLKQRFVKHWGYDCLQKCDFDIRNHVRVYEEDAQRCWTQEEFGSLIMPTLGQDFDGNAPQWEEVLIPNLKLEEEVCLARVLRYHHGYMDGASATLMISHCLCDSHTSDKFPHIINPLIGTKMNMGVKVILVKWFSYLRGGWAVVEALYKAAAVARKDPFVTEKYSGIRHYAWSPKLDTTVFRRVKSGGVCAPAVLATATASALGQIRKDKDNQDAVLGLVSALFPYADIRPRNQFTLVHFPIKIETETTSSPSPWAQRLKEVDRRMKVVPLQPQFYVNEAMFHWFGRMPRVLIRFVMRNAGNPISFSNVPMTREEMDVWGQRVSDVMGWAPLLTNTGMGLVIMRYASHIRFMGVADDACLSQRELQDFLKSVVEEINRMGQDCVRQKHLNLVIEDEAMIIQRDKEVEDDGNGNSKDIIIDDVVV